MVITEEFELSTFPQFAQALLKNSVEESVDNLPDHTSSANINPVAPTADEKHNEDARIAARAALLRVYHSSDEDAFDEEISAAERARILTVYHLSDEEDTPGQDGKVDATATAVDRSLVQKEKLKDDAWTAARRKISFVYHSSDDSTSDHDAKAIAIKKISFLYYSSDEEDTLGQDKKEGENGAGNGAKTSDIEGL